MNEMDRIRLIRKEKNITQKELCIELKMKQQQYSKYERGENELPIRYLKQIIAYLDVSADYILGFTDEPHPLPKK